MDKNGKIFGKLSIVDLAVIVLVIVLGVGLFYRFNASATNLDAADGMVAFVVRIEGVREFTLENYHEGLRVYDRMSNQFLGYMGEVRHEPHYQTAVNMYGEVIFASRPEHVTVFMQVISNGRITEQGIFAEGTFEVNTGSSIQINTKYVQVAGVIDSIQIWN